MRDVYQREIAGFTARLVDLTEMARWEMRKATCALLEDGLSLACGGASTWSAWGCSPTTPSRSPSRWRS